MPAHRAARSGAHSARWRTGPLGTPRVVPNPAEAAHPAASVRSPRGVRPLGVTGAALGAALLAPVVANALSLPADPASAARLPEESVTAPTLPGDPASAGTLSDDPASDGTVPGDPASALPLPTYVANASPQPNGGAPVVGLAAVPVANPIANPAAAYPAAGNPSAGTGRAACDVTVPPGRLTEAIAHAGLGEVVCVPGERHSAAAATHRQVRAVAARSAPAPAAPPPAVRSAAARIRHQAHWSAASEVADCVRFDVDELVHEVLGGYL